MNKYLLVFLSALIFSNFLYPQSQNSFQINGGMIRPINAEKGLATKFQYNHGLSSNWFIFTNIGYSRWDRDQITSEDSYGRKYRVLKNSYTEDDHHLVPINIGTRYKFNATKNFKPFLDLEIGYSYLTYNSYDYNCGVHIEDGDISCGVDRSTQKKENKDLFNMGVGMGIQQKLTNYLGLLLEFKLNSYLGEGYEGFFNSRNTVYRLTAGFNYTI